MKPGRLYVIAMSMILLGGVFVTSERFMNVENDWKTYFILVSVILLLVSCSASRQGLNGLRHAINDSGLAAGLSAISLLLSVYGLFQYAGYIPSRHFAFPITGTYENPAGYASVQAVLFPFALYLSLCKEQNRLIRLFAVTAAAICAVTVVLSGSRAGILAVSAAATVVLVLQTGVVSFLRRHIWLIVPLTGALIAAAFLLYSAKSDSANGRLLVWSVCFDMIKDRPLLGYGRHGFQAHYMDYQAAYFSAHPDSKYSMLADNVTHPFNEYVRLAVNFGLVGVLLSMGLLAVVIKRLSKSNPYPKVTGLSVVASVLVLCQFSYSYHYSAVWLVSVIAIAPALVCSEDGDKENKNRAGVRISVTTILSLLLMVVLRMMYLDLKWTEMSRRSLAGQTQRMLPYYERLKPKMRHNPLFLYNYAAELNYSGRYTESLAITKECVQGWNDFDVQMLLADNLENSGQPLLAIDAYRHASCMIPCRFEPLNSIMELSLASGDTIGAIETARQIVLKPVKVPSYRVDQIRKRAGELIAEQEHKGYIWGMDELPVPNR